MSTPFNNQQPLQADIYGQPQVKIESAGKDVFIISDLHLAAGVNASNNYDGTENFFADTSFVRFINSLEVEGTSKRSILVINGDFIDFLRICDYPTTNAAFKEWQQALTAIGITKSIEELQASIQKKERKFGLRTNDYKSVWKLHVCMKGHHNLFKRLALWLHTGNELIITKGNHDLEWYWKAVRDYYQHYTAKLLSTKLQQPIDTLLSAISNRITFVDDSLLIDGKIYIAHGHCYDSMTAVKGDVLSGNKEELNLPFGSFFNRYLINRIELAYPFVDNVRPRQNILLILFRERFLLALKMVFYYLPFTALLIPKKLWWETIKYALTFLFIVVLPIAITGFAIYKSLPAHAPQQAAPSWVVQQILSVGKNLGFLFLSYIFGRIMTLVKLKEPGGFIPDAKKILDRNTNLQVVTFGHTHNPEQLKNGTQWYFNTGTWIPIFEVSSADVRMDKTYTFLHLAYDEAGALIIRPLQRWNDDALRNDDLSLTLKT